LFLPLGIVLLRSRVLPKLLGYLALVLAAVFAALGVIFLLRLTLPDEVTALGAVQALWWLAAAVVLIARNRKFREDFASSQSEVGPAAASVAHPGQRQRH